MKDKRRRDNIQYGIVLAILLLPAQLFSQIDDIIHAYVSDTVFRNAGISICIRDVESGEILAGYNENMALTSASVMKLVTSGICLELLGPRMVFGTRLLQFGELHNGTLNGYLVIEGGGDPALGSEYFEEHYGNFLDDWLISVKEAGIKHINGPVVAETYVFGDQAVAPGWTWSDIGNYYGAGVYGINAFDNTYRIHFRTGEEGSSPEIIGIDPEIPGLEIENLLVASGTRDNGYVYLPPYGNFATIRGSIPVNRDTFSLKAAIPDPPLLLATMLHKRLIDAGITVSKGPATSRHIRAYMTDSLLSTMKHLHSEISPGLDQIIHITNLESSNLFAETLLRILDYLINQNIYAGPDGGLELISEYLESRGIAGGLYMVDGSGLSRSNALSSSFISDYLVYMGTESKYPELFKASLAVPGKGTFESYFLAPELVNNLRGKSGTVSRVRNYAGYLTSRSGKDLAFGVLHNNFDCSSHQVSKRVEKLMLQIYESF